MQSERKPYTYFYFIRILAAFLVLYNHLPAYHYYLSSGVSSYRGMLYLVSSVVTRINVPLFFMVSGALLLERNEDILTVIRKRVSKIILVLFIFSFPYYLEQLMRWVLYRTPIHFSLLSYLDGLLNNSIPGCGIYWFLYAYIGFLIMLPFLQRIVNNITIYEFRVILGLNILLSSILPICSLFLSMIGGTIRVSGSFSVPFATNVTLFYPLIGYYLNNRVTVTDIKQKTLFTICISTVVAILTTCVCIYFEERLTGEVTQTYIGLFANLLSINAFILIKWGVVKYGRNRPFKLVGFLSSLTFGIYLFDPILKPFFYNKAYAVFTEGVPAIASSIGWCIISMILGGAITFILKNTSLFRKLL